MKTETTTSAPKVGSSAVVLPVCPSSFQNHRQAAAWMIRMGRALDQSNVPISPHISRRDNNDNFEIARKLIECGKRIAEKYGDESKETKLRARLRAALARQNVKNADTAAEGVNQPADCFRRLSAFFLLSHDRP